jgi:hypothetical protein
MVMVVTEYRFKLSIPFYNKEVFLKINPPLLQYFNHPLVQKKSTYHQNPDGIRLV